MSLVYHVSPKKRHASAIKMLRNIIAEIERGAWVVKIETESGVEPAFSDNPSSTAYYATGRRRFVLEWSTVGMKPRKRTRKGSS